MGEGEVTYYLYADEGLIDEYDASGNLKKAYGWVPDSIWGTNPVFMLENNNYYFYHNDHLGTPQKMTDGNGNVVWSATYTAFGEAIIDPSSTVTNNLRFPGQYYDEETKKHYNWNRYYDPKTGRYTQVDPIGFSAGDENLYRYAFNNSLNSIDPDGQIVPVIIAGAVVVWGAVEVGLSVWDLITTVQTWLDPCEKLSTKLATTGLFFVGMVAPGGGYGTIGRKALPKSQGGLNLFKWKDTTSMRATGWKEGDYFLYVRDRGSAKLNWKLNSSLLRQEMAKGKPIFETYVDKVGNLIETKGFLNAERNLLLNRGWQYNPATRAWYPPAK